MEIHSFIIYTKFILFIIPYLSTICQGASESMSATTLKNVHTTKRKLVPLLETTMWKLFDEKDAGKTIDYKALPIPPIISFPLVDHTSTILFFHGLGHSGHSLYSIMNGLRQPYMKVIMPNANYSHVTWRDGNLTAAWFDLYDHTLNTNEDKYGIKMAAIYVHKLIDAEIKDGIPSNRIFLGGFSQGGALALYSALTYPEKLAGVVACSTWLPMLDHIPYTAEPANKNISILQCHHDRDPVVPYSLAQKSKTALQKVTQYVDFKTYPGEEHKIAKEEMGDIRNFFKNQAPEIKLKQNKKKSVD